MSHDHSSMIRFAPSACGLAAALTLVTASPAQTPKPTELHFGNEPWHLSLSLGDLKQTEGAGSGPDRPVFTYGNGKGTILSIMIENVHEPAVLASCRDIFDRRKSQPVAGIMPSNQSQATRGEAAVQEFDVNGELQGRKLAMHNVFTCRVRGTWYIDVHASRIPYEPGDHDALMAVAESVKIVD